MTFLDRPPEDPGWGHARGPGTEGVRLHYVRRGRGEAVVLLHGWPGFWYDWRRVVFPLSEGADVIAPDFRGFGGSDKPEGDARVLYAPDRLAADVLALLDHLGIARFVVVGHDTGAVIAQVLARGCRSASEPSPCSTRPTRPSATSRRSRPPSAKLGTTTSTRYRGPTSSSATTGTRSSCTCATSTTTGGGVRGGDAHGSSKP